jgi:phosphoesterase RecJ-like protein
VIDDRTWQEAVAALTTAERVLLLGHTSPDGDALGSALAVALALRAARPGVTLAVSFGDDPWWVPANLTMLPGQDLLVPAEDVLTHLGGAPDVVVTCDASSADRLGVLRPTAEACPCVIVLDHHVSYTGFGSLALFDVDAPATAVIAEQLVERLGVELDADIAANLYTGVVTDTGSFRYAATTPETMELGARLLRTGIPFDAIARDLFDTSPFAQLRVLGRALDRAVLEPDAVRGLGLVWTVVPALERRQSGLSYDLIEGVIDAVRKAEEAEIAAVVKETDSGELRVSLRSKGALDVSVVGTALGGGGHRYSAGYTAATTDLDRLLGELRKHLDDAAAQ